MNNYNFIEKENNIIKYGVVKNAKLKEYYTLNTVGIKLGNIYRARVLKKVASLNCFFVELEKGIDGFLDFKDIVGDVKCGDVILVEIYKVNQNGKAPNVTMNFSFSSDYSVIYYKNSKVLLSKKLSKLDFETPIFEELKENFGLKLRTSIESVNLAVLLEDIKKQVKKIKEIIDCKNLLPVPKLIYEKNNTIRDFIIKSDNDCIFNDKAIYNSFKEDLTISKKLILKEDYKAIYDLNISNVMSGLKNKVVEFDNINIVIENFEALTIIDVNSKFNFKEMDKSKNALNVNKLAIDEIIKQISFRDISGIILIDFINMKNIEKIEFEKYLNNIKIEDGKVWSLYGFTKTGLYEITRQRGNNGINK